MDITSTNAFTVSSSYEVDTSSFSPYNTFTTNPYYNVKGPLRTIRATTGQLDSPKSSSSLIKKLAILSGLSTIKAVAEPCSSITADCSLKRITATAGEKIYIQLLKRKASATFITSSFYEALNLSSIKASSNTFTSNSEYVLGNFLAPKKTTSTFNSTSFYEVFSDSNVVKPLNSFFTNSVYSLSIVRDAEITGNEFSCIPFYELKSTKKRKIFNSFVSTSVYQTENKRKTTSVSDTFVSVPQYEIISDRPFTTSNTFISSPSYKVVSTKEITVSTTFNSNPFYDFFEATNIKTAANTFISTSTYSVDTNSSPTQVANTFTTNQSYSVDTISIFAGVFKNFSGAANYSVKTFFDDTDTLNTFTTNQSYVVETVSIFAETDNLFFTSPFYEVEAISIFKNVGATFFSEAFYDIESITTLTTTTNTFGSVSNYVVVSATPVSYINTVTFNPTVNSSVYRTELLQPQSSLNNSGWLSSNQGVMVEDIGGIIPDDSTGISHFSVSSSDRSVSFDYGINNLSFLEERDNHTLKVRYYASSGLGSINLTIDIISGGVTRRTQTYNNVGQSIIQRDIVLTRTQTNNINYDDVQMRLTAFTTDGSNKQITVTWGVFEIPEVL